MRTLVSFPFTAIPTVKPSHSLKLATHRAETKGTSPQSGFLLLFDLSPSHLSFNLLLPLPSKETQCDDTTTILFIPFQVRSTLANAWCETAGLSRPSTYLKKEGRKKKSPHAWTARRGSRVTQRKASRFPTLIMSALFSAWSMATKGGGNNPERQGMLQGLLPGLYQTAHQLESKEWHSEEANTEIWT